MAGRTLPKHSYGRLDQRTVPAGEFVNLAPQAYRWPQIANATPGSAVHNHLVRWADQLKQRGPVLFAFNHEPESGTNTQRGTPAEYKAATRKVRQVFQQRGATNVRYVLQMTAWAFATKTTDRRHVGKWYDPTLHDYLGADPYNWTTCDNRTTSWLSLEQVTTPALTYARRVGKPLILAEVGSNSGPLRAQWLHDATQWIGKNRDTIHSIWYFQNQDPRHLDCRWPLQPGTDEAREWREMVEELS